ncbi:MAG: hypothetical protein Q9174_002705 [Haloplaca sp. 1 TL-2023]
MYYCPLILAASLTNLVSRYMYGGYAGTVGPGAEQYDEIWVLTLPAFQWIQVDASHNSARVGHTCHIVGKSQLLSIGGVDAAQSDPWSTVDTAFQGLGTFDLNGWEWTPGYNASAAPYKRADAIKRIYKDNDGSYPKTWDMPKLRDLVMQNFDPSRPNSSASASASASPALSKTERLGISIGASIGGVLLILLLGTLIFFYSRRRRRRRCHSVHNPRHTYPGTELSSESSKFELPCTGQRALTKNNNFAELDAGEVAAEKESGFGRTEIETKMEKEKSHFSEMSEDTVMEDPGGLFKVGYQMGGGEEMGERRELKPPTPPKVVVSPPGTRRGTGWF